MAGLWPILLDNEWQNIIHPQTASPSALVDGRLSLRIERDAAIVRLVTSYKLSDAHLDVFQ